MSSLFEIGENSAANIRNIASTPNDEMGRLGLCQQTDVDFKNCELNQRTEVDVFTARS
jgi:hypothetical protein